MYSRKTLFILITILLLTVNSCSRAVKETAMGLSAMPAPMPVISVNYDMLDAEEYNRIDENPFLGVLENPLSTFSVDVDTASYSNVRRMIKQGKLPPKDAVRIEELINYFTYNYPEPSNSHPFSVTTEMSACPWNEKNKLVRIGLKEQIRGQVCP